MVVNKATTRWVLFCLSTKSLLAVGLTKMLFALICLPDAEKDSLINNSWKRAMSWTISVAGLLGFFPKKLPDIVKQFLGSSGFWRVYSNLIALEPYAFFALVIRNVLPRALFWCTPREPPTCLLLDFLKSVVYYLCRGNQCQTLWILTILWPLCTAWYTSGDPKYHKAFSDLRCAYISACYAFSFLLTYTPLKPISSYDNDD